MSLRSSDPAAVDAAAEKVPSVIDALVLTIDPNRRARLDAWFGATGIVDTSALSHWLLREGEEAGWVAARWCRIGINALPKWAGNYPLGGEAVAKLRVVLETFAGRPASQWLWAEAFGAVPSDKRVLANHVGYLRHLPTHHSVAPIRKLLAARVSFRSILFDELQSAGELDVDDALAGLADPSLRETSEKLLRERVGEVEAELRRALPSATKGEREAIVRLLRRVDPRLGADGKALPADLGELEAALRANPRDLETSRIWADLLMDRGDPRGQLASFMHAMIGASPERALELSDQIATLSAQHRKQIFGKPGGFPFRDKDLGRGAIVFHSTWRAMMRGKPAKIIERVHGFLDRNTNLEPPAEASATKLEYAFKLSWPGTKTLLPFQEDGHYPTPPFGSRISVELESGKLGLLLAFPFESFDDRTFHLVYDTVAEALTKIVLTPTGFSLVTPTADGKRLKGKRARFLR